MGLIRICFFGARSKTCVKIITLIEGLLWSLLFLFTVLIYGIIKTMIKQKQLLTDFLKNVEKQEHANRSDFTVESLTAWTTSNAVYVLNLVICVWIIFCLANIAMSLILFSAVAKERHRNLKPWWYVKWGLVFLLIGFNIWDMATNIEDEGINIFGILESLFQIYGQCVIYAYMYEVNGPTPVRSTTGFRTFTNPVDDSTDPASTEGSDDHELAGPFRREFVSVL